MLVLSTGRGGIAKHSGGAFPRRHLRNFSIRKAPRNAREDVEERKQATARGKTGIRVEREYGKLSPYLSVQLHRGVALELVPHQVGVVGGGDEVAGQRVVHVLGLVLLLLLRGVAATVPGAARPAGPAAGAALAAVRLPAAVPPDDGLARRRPLPLALHDGRVGRVHQVAREALEAELPLGAKHGVGLVNLYG